MNSPRHLVKNNANINIFPNVRNASTARDRSHCSSLQSRSLARSEQSCEEAYQIYRITYFPFLSAEHGRSENVAGHVAGERSRAGRPHSEGEGATARGSRDDCQRELHIIGSVGELGLLPDQQVLRGLSRQAVSGETESD